MKGLASIVGLSQKKDYHFERSHFDNYKILIQNVEYGCEIGYLYQVILEEKFSITAFLEI